MNPILRLNNDVAMPAFGLGVFRTSVEETADVVETALSYGYRLIDTAAAYRNEKQVGEGIARSGVNRGDLFIQTKLWISDFGHEFALRAFELSRKKLGLEYVDLYLLHWPTHKNFQTTITAYKALEKLLADGLVRAIGVCNHEPGQLAQLIEATGIVPAVNQVELHPYFIQTAVRQANERNGIITQSWSPIGGVIRNSTSRARAGKDCLEEPVLKELAEKYGKTPAQVVLRWHIDHGLSAIPKTVRPERLKENMEIFDFALEDEEIARIDALDTGVRSGPDPETHNMS